MKDKEQHLVLPFVTYQKQIRNIQAREKRLIWKLAGIYHKPQPGQFGLVKAI